MKIEQKSGLLDIKCNRLSYPWSETKLFTNWEDFRAYFKEQIDSKHALLSKDILHQNKEIYSVVYVLDNVLKAQGEVILCLISEGKGVWDGG